MLESSLELSLVEGTVIPLFAAKTVLQIFDPQASVLGPIFVVVDPVAVCLVVDEFALVHVAIHMVEDSLPVGLTVSPLSLVLGSVLPHLGASAVLNNRVVRGTPKYLTSID